MKQNNSFFTTIRRKLFGNRVNREIFDKIFPHLNRTADHGYPFQSDDEMVGQHISSGLDAQMKFDMIERAAAEMPKAYGDAFRYVAYRDLNERMEMYLEIAKERIQPKAGIPHLAAVAHSA